MDLLTLRLTKLVPVVRRGETTADDALTVSQAVTEIASLRARVRDLEDIMGDFELDIRMAIERASRSTYID